MTTDDSSHEEVEIISGGSAPAADHAEPPRSSPLELLAQWRAKQPSQTQSETEHALQTVSALSETRGPADSAVLAETLAADARPVDSDNSSAAQAAEPTTTAVPDHSISSPSPVHSIDMEDELTEPLQQEQHPSSANAIPASEPTSMPDASAPPASLTEEASCPADPAADESRLQPHSSAQQFPQNDMEKQNPTQAAESASSTSATPSAPPSTAGPQSDESHPASQKPAQQSQQQQSSASVSKQPSNTSSSENPPPYSFHPSHCVYFVAPPGAMTKVPPHCRLFIGNLAPERTSKDEIARIFVKYGNILEISFKSSYGFVQYDNAASCQAAIDGENFRYLAGMKIDLKVSKDKILFGPDGPRRRDEERRGGSNRSGSDAHDRSRFRDRGRSYDRRDDYDDRHRYRDRDYDRGRDMDYDRDRRDRSSRSPPPYMRQTYDGRYPHMSDGYGRDGPMDGPRHHPHMPQPPHGRPMGHLSAECQIVAINEIDRNFLMHVESTLRRAGISTNTLYYAPHMNLNALVEQIRAGGAIAVVFLEQNRQLSGSVAAQVFNPQIPVGPGSVTEFDNIPIDQACAIILQNRQMHGRGGPVPGAAHPFSFSQQPFVQQPSAPIQQQAPPGHANAYAPAASGNNPQFTNAIAALVAQNQGSAIDPQSYLALAGSQHRPLQSGSAASHGSPAAPPAQPNNLAMLLSSMGANNASAALRPNAVQGTSAAALGGMQIASNAMNANVLANPSQPLGASIQPLLALQQQQQYRLPNASFPLTASRAPGTMGQAAPSIGTSNVGLNNFSGGLTGLVPGASAASTASSVAANSNIAAILNQLNASSQLLQAINSVKKK